MIKQLKHQLKYHRASSMLVVLMTLFTATIMYFATEASQHRIYLSSGMLNALVFALSGAVVVLFWMRVLDSISLEEMKKERVKGESCQ